MEVRFCERINGSGLFSKIMLEEGATVFSLCLDRVWSHPTRESIELRPGVHVDDPFGAYMNHNCKPNTKIDSGGCVVALTHISPGDELTFDYNTTESSVAFPFTTSEGVLVVGYNPGPDEEEVYRPLSPKEDLVELHTKTTA